MGKDDRELIERLGRLRDMPTAEISDADLTWWLRQPGAFVPSRIREFAATRLEALQAQPVGAIGDVAAERQRQIAVEGWAPDHDDAHTDRSLAQAGACYVLHDVRCLPMDRRGKLTNQLTPELWPWEPRWWKPKSYRENLVRGAALIVAEIERLDREAASNG